MGKRDRKNRGEKREMNGEWGRETERIEGGREMNREWGKETERIEGEERER